MTGILDIAAERQRQIEQEGWTPEQSRETVRAVERIVRDQMITAAFVLNASGLSERQANSLVANIVAKLAWEMNKAERKSAGEIPDPDRFLSMVKDHVQ